ncbi:MAG TPA: hypothetical protein DEB39_05955 [Planctomycetaceae bacterium]|nr:hypothetical protein [Planctomycetaceae bacterium]
MPSGISTVAGEISEYTSSFKSDSLFSRPDNVTDPDKVEGAAATTGEAIFAAGSDSAKEMGSVFGDRVFGGRVFGDRVFGDDGDEETERSQGL